MCSFIFGVTRACITVDHCAAPIGAAGFSERPYVVVHDTSAQRRGWAGRAEAKVRASTRAPCTTLSMASSQCSKRCVLDCTGIIGVRVRHGCLPVLSQAASLRDKAEHQKQVQARRSNPIPTARHIRPSHRPLPRAGATEGKKERATGAKGSVRPRLPTNQRDRLLRRHGHQPSTQAPS